MNEEIRAILETQHHIQHVQVLLGQLARKLQARSDGHDLSKWLEDEFSGMLDIKKANREHGYQSPQYQAALKSAGIAAHFERNSHHPEHYPNGIKGMSLFDIIEMVCDWTARVARDGKTIEDQMDFYVQRFELDENHVWLIRLVTVELMRGEI